MEEKNIALLGFISSASNYLKNQANGNSKNIDKLKTVNLDYVKEELAKKVSSTFGNSNVSNKDLVDIGRQTFEEFINEKKTSLIDEFNDIFNIDFEDEEEAPDEITAHLLELLKSPVELEEPVIKIEEVKPISIIKEEAIKIMVEEPKEEEKPEEVVFFKPFIKEDPSIFVINRDININEIVKNLKTIINEDKVLEVVEESAPKFDTSKNFRPFVKEDPNEDLQDVEVNFDEVLQDVEDIVDKETTWVVVEDEEPKFDTSKNFKPFVKEDPNEGLQDVEVNFDEVLQDVEDIVDKETTWVVVEDEEPKFDTAFKKTVFEEKDDLEELSKQETITSNQEVEEEFKEIESFVNSEEQKSYESAINDETVDEYVKIIANNISRKAKEDQATIKEAQAEMDDLFYDIINHNDDVSSNRKSLSSELSEIKNNEYVYQPILNPAYFALEEDYEKEKLKVEETTNTPVEAEFEETTQNEDSTYISSLLNEFTNSKIADTIEENIRNEEEENDSIFKQIGRLYPYLSEGFIKTVFSLKEQISEEYKDKEQIIILHRLNFDDINNLQKFIELVLSHDYAINADETKMIVDIFKKHKNVDGKILTDIFEVANQAKLLAGEYEGYRVILDEE